MCILALASFAAVASQAQSPENENPKFKWDAVLQNRLALKSTRGWTSAIIKIKGELTPQREASLKSLGADIYRHLAIIDSVALRIPTRNLKRLAELTFVSHLSDDMGVKKCDEFTVGASGADVAFSQYGLTGDGVGVAVLDSGIQSRLDLLDSDGVGTRIIVNQNMTSEKDAYDYCGHGTHVAGIIGGNGTTSAGFLFYHSFYGIARKSNLINVRVLDSIGMGTVSQVVAGVQWVTANKTKYNIRVLNLSLGHPVGESYKTDPLCQALESAWKAGIVVVCAAGNNGRLQNTANPSLDNEGYGTSWGSIQSPGNDPFVITVGAAKIYDALRSHDRVATYSSRGPSRLDYVLKPDIIAPGNHITSLNCVNGYLENTYAKTNSVPWASYSLIPFPGNSASYFQLSGTSMAAPVVSGAAALLLEKYPSLTPDTIKARLMLSADKWADPQGIANPCTYGAGYLNIPAAIVNIAAPTQFAKSPTLIRLKNGNVVIKMDNAIWGQNAIWGIYGVTDFRSIWGVNAIWGASSNILSNSNAIWGKTFWSDNAIWGVSSAQADISAAVVNGD